MTERLGHDIPTADAAELWTATQILMGLKYEVEVVSVVLQKVRSIMVQSTTYQEILKDGREKGKQEMLLLVGERRFGNLPDEVRRKVFSIHDVRVLDDLSLRMLDVESWDQLLSDVS